MTYSEKVTTVNTLLQQNASQVQAWLDAVWSGQQQAPDDFNWLGLAETAASNAHTSQDRSALAWARIANSIYDYLINHSNSAAQDSLAIAQMNLHASMIRNFGIDPSDPLLNADRIVQWFLREQRMSLEEAEQKATTWKQLPVEDIRKLRGIKNRISVIKPLVESGQTKPDQRLKNWVALWEKLP